MTSVNQQCLAPAALLALFIVEFCLFKYHNPINRSYSCGPNFYYFLWGGGIGYPPPPCPKFGPNHLETVLESSYKIMGGGGGVVYTQNAKICHLHC